MKKRVVVGDPHGRWGAVKHIYERENPDEFIILGDYFDSFTIHPIDQRECYENILKLREEHMKSGKGKFIMLIGNHDMHYLTDYIGQHSGYNRETEGFAGYFVERDMVKGILQYVYIDKTNRIIYSHAGVSMRWLKKWCDGKLENITNELPYKAFEFSYLGNGDMFGSSPFNGPTWIRPEGLTKVTYKDDNGPWTQVFGHTASESPSRLIHSNGAENICIDCICKCYLVETFENDFLDKRELVETNLYLSNE